MRVSHLFVDYAYPPRIDSMATDTRHDESKLALNSGRSPLCKGFHFFHLGHGYIAREGR